MNREPDLINGLEEEYLDSWYPIYGRKQFLEWHRVDLRFALNTPSIPRDLLEAVRSEARRRNEEDILDIQYMDFSFEDAEKWWVPAKGRAYAAFCWRKLGFEPEDALRYQNNGIKDAYVAYLIDSLGVPVALYSRWKSSAIDSRALDVISQIKSWIDEFNGDLGLIEDIGLEWEKVNWNSNSAIGLYRYFMHFSDGNFRDNPSRALRWASSWQPHVADVGRDAARLETFSQLFEDPEDAIPWIGRREISPEECFGYDFLGLTVEEAVLWHDPRRGYRLLQEYIGSGIPFDWALRMETGEGGNS